MPFTLEQVQGKVPVTVLAIDGELDASNYKDIIAEAEEIYKAGTRCILIDLSETSFISSSGIVALHSITRIFQDKQAPDPEEGWEAFHSIDRNKDSGVQENVKLLNPQPRVNYVLEISGMKKFFEIYTDLEEAVASFK